MIQLKVLCGSKAGDHLVVRRFPFRIGRAADADLRLTDSGVWDQHLRLDFRPADGLVFTAQGDALVTLNNQPVTKAVLRNGDFLGLGSARLQFWLAETRQRGLRLREFFVWSCIVFVTLAQVALLYALLR